jgi:hypothetical protein
MHSPLARFLATAAATVTLACDDAFAPSMSNVSGTYTATTFTSTNGGATTNHLAAGASLTITLLSNGTTTGRLFIPGASEEGGGDLDADMAGTWTLNDSTVEFAQTADTFVRDMAFTASRDRLSSEETFGSYTIRVTITK